MKQSANETLDHLSTPELQTLDREHHLHPFTEYKSLHETGSRIISRAEGIYVWDSDGNRILDGMAGLWCVNIGYGRHELARAAAQQLKQLPYYNTFFQTSHTPAIELTKTLAEITPDGFNSAFLTNSGSEANDTVIRMVRRYWDLQGKPEKSIIISRLNAYHGSTMGAASLGGMDYMHQQGGMPIPDIVHIRQPYWFKEGREHSPDKFGEICANALEEKIRAIGANKVAAFIGEPVQGAGGVVIPPETYWPKINKICKKYGILLVADEVICGFGRTGKWFGSDFFGIEPDLMTLAKGLSSGYLPIAGVMVSDKVASTLIESDEEFAHGFTYSGHPASCAVAIENIRILKEEGIIDHVAQIAAPSLNAQWRSLESHPLVGEARSVGLLGALELVMDSTDNMPFDAANKVGIKCRDLCMNAGLVMRAVGDTMVISPPLIITESQIEELVDIARNCLDQLERLV